MFGLAASVASAQTPVFDATFPASWSGTGTAVTDLSGAGNTGFQSGTASYTTATVPPGAPGGTGSMALTGVGGIKVPTTYPTPTPTLLNNTAVAAAGGFTYNIDFLWNGTDSTAYSHVQKLIDYAGTESLQLVTTSGGSATLEMLFDPGDTTANSSEVVAVSTTIAANTWYNVTLSFDATGMSGSDVTGLAFMQVNGGTALQGLATKGLYGDSLDRAIGIGEFGYGHSTSIIGLRGDIYDASINLGATLVPEPTALALSTLGGLGLLFLRRRKS